MDEQYAWLYEEEEDRIRAAEEILNRPSRLDREILARSARAELLRRSANRFGTRMQKDRVISTPDPTRAQALLAEAVDEEREALRLEEERELAYLAAAEHIARAESPEAQKVLELRYLERWTWDAIGAETRYSKAQLFRLRRRGLEEMARPRP